MSSLFAESSCLCSFGGVGATIAYTDTMEVENVTVVSSSEVLSTEVGLKAETTVIVLIAGFSLAAEIGYTGEFETSRSTEKGNVQARSRSFVLGDADDGDYFDVQVCDFDFLCKLSIHLLNRFSWILCMEASFSAP